MLADELLCHERAHGVAEQYNRDAGVLGGDMIVQVPEVVEAIVPAVLRTEETEIRGCACGTAMPPMVAGKYRVSGACERLGQAGVSSRVLGQPVRDLHHGFGRRPGQPAIDEQDDTVVGAESKGGAPHVLLERRERACRHGTGS